MPAKPNLYFSVKAFIRSPIKVFIADFLLNTERYLSQRKIVEVPDFLLLLRRSEVYWLGRLGIVFEAASYDGKLDGAAARRRDDGHGEWGLSCNYIQYIISVIFGFENANNNVLACLRQFLGLLLSQSCMLRCRAFSRAKDQQSLALV